MRIGIKSICGADAVVGAGVEGTRESGSYGRADTVPRPGQWHASVINRSPG